MKKIEVIYNQHLYTEVQVRFSYLPVLEGAGGGLGLCAGGGISPPWGPGTGSGPWPPPSWGGFGEPLPSWPGGSRPGTFGIGSGVSPKPTGPNFLSINFVITYVEKPEEEEEEVCPPADDTVFEPPDTQESGALGYSAGLGAVGVPGCVLLHQHMYDDYETLEIVIFDYEGNRVETACVSTGWPQCVRKIGDSVWFSYTGAEGAGFYSIPWDETLQSYPASEQEEVIVDYNWDVKQSPDGKIFICGAEGMSGGHKISYVDTEDNNTIIPVIEVGGNSSGFAIDPDGNIWSGEYVLGWSPSMHIEPCRLGRWPKAAVENAIITHTPLTWDDADVVIPLGTTDITGETTNWGPNDIEADSQGNIYVSMNTYSSWGSSSEYGRVVKVYPNEEEIYIMDEIWQTEQRINKWDWARTLAFDGTNLFLDLDMTQCNDEDNLIVVSYNYGQGTTTT